MGTGAFDAGATLQWTTSHPGGGQGVEILLVALCYRNGDKVRPDGPLGSYTGFTFTFPSMVSFS